MGSARTEQSVLVGAIRLAVLLRPRRAAVVGKIALSPTSGQVALSKSRKVNPSPTTKNQRGRRGTAVVSPVPTKMLPLLEVATARRTAEVDLLLPNRPVNEVVWFGLRDC